jgi:mannose-6-phosphate isomerase-like protein (cupin superfamily)
MAVSTGRPSAALRFVRQASRHEGIRMNDSQEYPYATFLNVLYPSLSLVDVPSLAESCTERWYNQTLCKVNDSVVRLGVLQGEYHWHKHDNDDEFFFVLDGRFIVDLEDRSVELHRQQGFVVPKGVVHRTRAPERAVILMVETATIIPTGDA